MIYYRCKCGKHEAWSSGMNPAPCSGCKECGVTVATHPDGHEPVQPHDFSLVGSADTDAGPQPLTRCKWCFRTHAQIAKTGES